MAELFGNGRFIDLILMLIVLEVVGLALYWRIARRGIPLQDCLPNILAGAFLLLATRLVLGGADWIMCCACLAAAGAAHLADLHRRWRS